ncbi:hypothetical protein F5884DRAFT_785281 [Xylogone sp. PMI_703]|nr:hypothetical protein F5884DRAFT_785281 [Xylogone sp. PMI_703]
MRDLRQPILDLLHTCRASRSVVLKSYRLDLDSNIKDECPPFWDEGDIVYFYTFPDWMDERALIYWLSQRQHIYPSTFSTLQHLAIHLNQGTSSLLGVYLHAVSQHQWLQRFPSLQSMILLIDPYRQLLFERKGMGGGTILLYEPENVRVQTLGYTTPSDIVSEVTKELADTTPEGKEVPLVEIFTCGVKSPRNKRRTAKR